tara:strand:+ start:2601 stop:3845 length:1245 start_codon:yes stop_codon:yes gene_type:complete
MGDLLTEENSKVKLLVAKGTFEAMRGAERDLIRNLPALSNDFDLTVATIQPSKELRESALENNFKLLSPEKSWYPSNGTIGKIMNVDLRSSTKAWKSISGLKDTMTKIDAVHLVSGDGSFGIIRLVPNQCPFHLYMLEPHRGLYEDVLHLDVRGNPKRNMNLTRLGLKKMKRDDQRIIANFLKREKVKISGNSSYSADRIEEVYGYKAGFIHPSVDFNEFSLEATHEENESWVNLEELPDPPWVTTIGHSGWSKGVWETISMLTGSGIGLVLVGGGSFEEIEDLHDHANSRSVRFWTPPRLTNLQLNATMRRSIAVVSMAHGEPFGLTPIEAFAVGTPALFVDEGGFRDTIDDGINGRLIARNDLLAWQNALKEASEHENRKKWAKEGRAKIERLNLSPEGHSKRIKEIIEEII